MNVIKNEEQTAGCYKLWKDCFGDSKEYMDYYFTKKTEDNEIYEIKKDGEVISMLHLNPFRFLVKGHPMKLHYIVGVATKQEERGQGLMRSILTQTLKRQQERGELFTYLMPAAKEIYLPYDFRYMYTQQRISGTWKREEERGRAARAYEGLSDTEKLEAVRYVNDRIARDFDCAVERDSSYYDRLSTEMQAAGGNVIACRDKEGLLGIVAFMLENGHMEVVETVTDPECTEKVLGQIKAYVAEHYDESELEIAFLETHFLDQEKVERSLLQAKKADQPIIMARLLCAKEAIGLLSLKDGAEEFVRKIQVEDPVIEANNRIFQIRANRSGIAVIESEGKADLAVSIAELTEWFFGVRKIAPLSGIETVSAPYINDIV